MTDQELSPKEILAQLQKATSSIDVLSGLVKDQAKTIEELKAAKTSPAAPSTPSTGDDLVKELQSKLDKSIETNNNYVKEQRKEKLDKSVEEGLLARGTDPQKLQYAKAFIKDKIFIDKAGNMKMIDQEGNENTLEAGLDQFADSEHGNVFRAPVQVNGAGMQSFSAPNRKPAPPSDPTKKMSDKDFNKWIQQSLGR